MSPKVKLQVPCFALFLQILCSAAILFHAINYLTNSTVIASRPPADFHSKEQKKNFFHINWNEWILSYYFAVSIF